MIQDLIQDIHSTLKNYSVGLKQQNYLLEKAWTLVDGNLNVHRLIFKKKGVLRAFKNGNLEDNCTWDYEPSINSLILKIGHDAVVLNEIFLDDQPHPFAKTIKTNINTTIPPRLKVPLGLLLPQLEHFLPEA